jgi:hypothetical protein
MATPSGTHTSYTVIGEREDLSDIIYNVDPYDTPFMASIRVGEGSQVLHEWQSDSFAAASSSNAVLEGDDATTDTATATTRLSNSMQIADKVARVSGTARASRTAGRADELDYQIEKRAIELRTDVESVVLRNGAEATGDTTTARQCGGIGAWITTNTSNGSGGSDGSLGNTARTDGTQRDVTEALLKSVIQSQWTNGGKPDCLMCGAHVKQEISTFTGNATRFKTAEDKQLVAAIDLYQSDFGDLEIIPNRFMRSRDLLVLQKDLWAIAYLRPFHFHELAKTGDSDRIQILVEFTLESSNEAGSGAVWDLNTS